MGMIRKSLYLASQGMVSPQSTKQRVAAATMVATQAVAKELAMQRWEIEHAEREARWIAYQAAKASA
jgi:hypothetical protein